MEKLLFTCCSIFTIVFIMSAATPHKNDRTPEAADVQTDGPYVLYSDGQIFVNYIMERNGKKWLKTENVRSEMKETVSLKVMTDIPGKSFRVRLKKNLKNEKSEFGGVKRIFALSDIEGNFGAFRKLLQAGNVIDENLNWKFGDGNLVLIGDFFDRGEQVTETLWFIYYLEEKARAAGGYVHFILGNHEIMNLAGDLRYTRQKYLDNAKLLSLDYISLYNENSELGTWLRTKNAVEKIGNILFLHGGISADVNSLDVSIDSVNSLARPYYNDKPFDDNDKKLAVIFGDAGPFWYRGYYDKINASIPSQIDSTLSKFGAHQIVTGHTIVADTISVWYHGKLLDTDVHHAEGKSEALLIEEGKYYRVNAEGKRVLLMETGK